MDTKAYEVHNTAEKGRFLVATRDFLPGNIIFKDPPFFLVSPGEHKMTNACSSLSGIDEIIWGAFFAFVDLPDSTQKKLLSHFIFPTTGPFAQRIREAISKFIQTAKKASSQSPHSPSSGALPSGVPSFFSVIALMFPTTQEIEEFVKIACSMNFFSVFVSPPGPDGKPLTKGNGLFVGACLLSHSCIPNCTWHSDEKGNRIIRAILPIKAEEELTIDYSSEQVFFKPTLQRQEYTQRTKEFSCTCLRCKNLFDDVRPFFCLNKLCTGYHYASPIDPCLLPCIRCGVTLDSFEQKRWLEKERKLQETLNYINHILNSQKQVDICKLLLDVASEFPCGHFLMYELNSIKYEFFLQCGLWDKAKTVLTSCLDFFHALRHVHEGKIILSRTEAFMWEFLGDMNGKLDNVKECSECYRKSLELLETCCGVDSGYYQCVIGKSKGRDGDGVKCSYCGKKPAVLQRCARCKKVFYCGRPCQLGHWKVHKSVCAV